MCLVLDKFEMSMKHHQVLKEQINWGWSKHIENGNNSYASVIVGAVCHVKEWNHWGKEGKRTGPWKMPQFEGRSDGETQEFEYTGSWESINFLCLSGVWCCSVNKKPLDLLAIEVCIFISDHYESSRISFSDSKVRSCWAWLKPQIGRF